MGRGLAAGEDVFVKLMSFPRPRDRLRYAFRCLPAVHEARMLELVARLGIPCPAVLAVRAARRGPLPRRSMLVLRALSTRADADLWGPRGLEERAALTRRLLEGGILHPDLHADNFVRLEDGRLAVLDLQSARPCTRAATLRTRIAVAARLVEGLESASPRDVEEMVERPFLAAGLLPNRDAVARAIETAARFRRAWVASRIRRCLAESTEFAARFSWRGIRHERRSSGEGVAIHRGGRELRQWWIGDRALEVLEGRSPRLHAYFRPWPWFPGQHAVYILPPYDEVGFRSEVMDLQEGFGRYRSLSRGISPGEGT